MRRPSCVYHVLIGVPSCMMLEVRMACIRVVFHSLIFERMARGHAETSGP